MKDGGRLAAAIEVLTEVETRHRPVQIVLKEWGNAHRFAGSGDRTAIGNLVFDALRHKASLAAGMGDDSPRSLALATYCHSWRKGLEGLNTALADPHAPATLQEAERLALSKIEEGDLKADQAADVPEWLWSRFETIFGENAVKEGQALATRAPVDLRVNTLKHNREKLLKSLANVKAQSTPFSPVGMRIQPAQGASRMPHLQAEEGYRKGWFELQDEASQLAALIARAQPGEQVLDYCAGGGGKTLAFAATMQNKGQLYAYDADRLRLAPIHERLQRAGVGNVQVRDPAKTNLDDLVGNMDLVFIDAPCTGTGVWRRRPDSKWRLTEKALEDRITDQRRVLEDAKNYVKIGGRLVYATCSILKEENQDQIELFLNQNSDFKPLSAFDFWKESVGDVEQPKYVSPNGDLLLTPASTQTDGFFISLLQRVS